MHRTDKYSRHSSIMANVAKWLSVCLQLSGIISIFKKNAHVINPLMTVRFSKSHGRQRINLTALKIFFF